MRILRFGGTSDARGRNNWFRLWSAEVYTTIPEGMVTIDLFSIRKGRTAPIILRLTPADATTLARELLTAAVDADTAKV